ncbi:hypothetical protein K461DRAFT_273758 [Myriangium duriaei CBS 260.36]|uniref:Uncharacterized protein n=1 Tax=Myriangium duriaei CBS 260.36 TaxID=1168546 RepID=A0A9P4MJW2_9PEZI|nr:hypothetical protein K461DRAFT_273758 [Myriangium duriaei CBS 260.36]
MAAGVPAVDPCTPSFDLALDESVGYYYSPTQARHSHSRELLIIAEAREDVITEYAISQLDGGSERIEIGPGIGRPGQLRDIWKNIRKVGDNVWKGVEGVGDAFRRAPKKTRDVFKKMPGKLNEIGHIIWLGLNVAGRSVVEDFKKLGQAVAKSAGQMRKLVVGGLDQLQKLIQTWEPDISAKFDIDLAPTKLVDSPWGEAWLLFKYASKSRRPPYRDSYTASGGPADFSLEPSIPGTSVDVDVDKNKQKPPNTGDPKRAVKLYCVRCGLHSHTQINGKARFSILHGVQALNVGMDGNFEFGMNVGIDGDISQVVHTKDKKIIPPISTIPGTTIPGVLTFGPIVSMSLRLDSSLHSKGRALSGVNVGLPAFSAAFDFVHPSNSQVRGFNKMVFNQFYKSGRQVSASAKMHMPFSIGVGVIIPRIKFNQQVKMINSPSFDAQATMSGKCRVGKHPPDITIPDDPDCNGVTHSLGFSHVVTFEFFNKYKKTMTLIKYPRGKGCRKVDGETNAVLDTVKRASVCAASTDDDDGAFIGNSSSAVYNNRGAFWRTVPSKISLKKPTFIIDSSREVILVSALDGNIYMVPFNEASRLPDKEVSTAFVDLTQANARWVQPDAKQKFLGSRSRTIITDGYDHGFYYFPDTLAKWGATRIRMLSVDEVPANAKQTIMEDGKLLKDGTKGFYFIDADSPFSAMYPVVCTVQDAKNRVLPKLFAVSDLDKGLDNLRSDMEVASAITGGIVKDCGFIHLVQTNTFGRGQ